MEQKYFLYTRKSSESEERQILSLESQLAELHAYAEKEHLTIVEEFSEAMTAKQPGRPIFNEMVARLEQGDANGIIAWHPDRLARNSVDGGRLIYLLDTKHLHALKFPTFWFENTPQGKFMLQIAFGQSKYYVDNLSENVKRGLRHKIRTGVWPGWAPMGYLNDKNSRTVVIDPVKGPLVQQLFEAYATGQYTLADLKKISFAWGLTNRAGAPLVKSELQRTLTRPFYYGLMHYAGEWHHGTHAPLITKQLFDQVQHAFDHTGRPHKYKKHVFALLGLATCATCGGAITAERQKGHHYYRCTKKMGPCREPYVREELFAQQIRAALGQVTVSPAVIEYLQTTWHQSAQEIQQPINQHKVVLAAQQAALTRKLDRLLDAHLEGLLEPAEYQSKKSQLLNEKIALEEKVHQVEQQGVSWLEPCKKFIQSLQDVASQASGHELASHKQLLKKIGSNFHMGGKRLGWRFDGPWQRVADWSLQCQDLGAAIADQGITHPAAVAADTRPPRHSLANLRREWDSNPRYREVNTLSKRAPSATRPSLHHQGAHVAPLRRQRYFTTAQFAFSHWLKFSCLLPPLARCARWALVNISDNKMRERKICPKNDIRRTTHEFFNFSL